MENKKIIDPSWTCILGVCVMDNKARSKPMLTLLDRLRKQHPGLQTIIFGNEIILNERIEKWPICDALISFYSIGFPLDKAIEYTKLRAPFCINSLPEQKALLDRKLMYQIFDEYNIPSPRHLFIERTPDMKLLTEYVQTTEYLEIKNAKLYKPFVEKPLNAEDHNVRIYFPLSKGGGCTRLFRKTDDRSSVYEAHIHCIRDDGSYLYEEFITTDHSSDIKVYMVGPTFVYAERRKAPVVDGIVDRAPDGSEKRSTVSLNSFETEMVLKVYHAFRQTVCGFDILRTESGVSFVCDINGWSFVKSSEQYYDTCCNLLMDMLYQNVHKNVTPTTIECENQMELK